MELLCALSDIGLAILFLAISLPMVYHKVPMNLYWGARLRQAFQSDEAWYDINEYAARQFIRWSLGFLAVGIASLFIPFQKLGNDIAQIVPPLVTLAGVLAVACIPLFRTYKYVAKHYPDDPEKPANSLYGGPYYAPNPGGNAVIFYALGAILLVMALLILTIVLLASHYGGNLAHTSP